jgi:hypothetical protein
VILEMPMTSLVRLSMGPERTEVTGVFWLCTTVGSSYS